MKRWWLLIALLLSVGVNVGILATLAFQSGFAKGVANAETGDAETGDAGAEAGGVVATDDGAAGGSVTDGSTEKPPRRDGRFPPVIRRMANELDLEGEKRTAFVEFQREFFDQTLSARARMERLQREIRREVTSGDPDRDVLERLLLELSAAHTDLERAFVNNLLDSRELLDSEQEKRFMHFLRRMRQVRHGVEQRFRERWRGSGERRDLEGPGSRGRLGADRPGGQRSRRRPPPERPGHAERAPEKPEGR